MKYIFLSLLFVTTVFAQYPIELPKEYPAVKKYNGIFMRISKQESNLYMLQLYGTTFAEKKEDTVILSDKDFAATIKEVEVKTIYELIATGSNITHASIDVIKDQKELRYLNLSKNKNIGDETCRKIGEYLPKLERLNLYQTAVTDKGLEYLSNLKNLRALHLFGSKVTFKAASDFRNLMAQNGNDDLEITIGGKHPALGSIKYNAFLKATYQKNTDSGKLNPDFKVGVAGETKPNKKYEDSEK